MFKGKRFQSKGLIDTKVYFKPRDSHQLLHKQSFHPKHTFSGILKSQIIRYDRICSDPQDLENACDILFKSLRERGYSKRYLRSIKNKTLKEFKQKRQLKVGSIKLCQTCNFTQKTTQIKKGNETVKIFQNLNCNSTFLIYLIHCDNCVAQYVGKTRRTLRERFNGHRADVRLTKRTNVAVHFDGCLCNFEDCQLYPNDEIPDTLSQEANKKLRLERGNLKTYPPYGMNSGANANSESIMPLTIQYSSTAKLASHKIR